MFNQVVTVALEAQAQEIEAEVAKAKAVHTKRMVAVKAIVDQFRAEYAQEMETLRHKAVTLKQGRKVLGV